MFIIKYYGDSEFYRASKYKTQFREIHMQAQAQETSMISLAMLPLLMLSDSNNQELIMFMVMMKNQNC